jgi:hypothetical protein
MQPEQGAPALAWAEQTVLATAMRQELWLYPAVEIVHIWGFVVLVGSITMLDLRLLGLSPQVSVQQLSRHLLPWTWGALLVIVPSGIMMFVTHAGEFISNRAFVLKMLLIFAASLNAAAFQVGPYRGVQSWDSGVSTPAAAKLHAALSLLIWMGVIACGRLLAYL